MNLHPYSSVIAAHTKSGPVLIKPLDELVAETIPMVSGQAIHWDDKKTVCNDYSVVCI